ncbi:MAG: hypothetical protein JJ939_12030 [Alphaproteobacteria bacterium]|nr:hypothetical protein [Alphaproteobacteria bacterium]MBO6629141.1 hypothetical protein [Alphaproteobacteria bacterium]
MAITQAICNSFRQECLQGVHDFDNDTFKIALYTSSATLSKSTTAYSATNEVSGTGYTAGGKTLTGAALSMSGDTAIIDFADPTWSASSITARGALIYNSSKSNKAVMVLDFSADRTSDNGPFTVQFPDADASNALLRIAPA